MLVLGRKATQAVVLEHKVTGERIKVTMIRCEGLSRIGFDASKDWLILREEKATNCATDRTSNDSQ